MGFTQLSSREAQVPRQQGPAKLVVTLGMNGRTQISFSAAVRDHLRPNQGWRVSVLVDQAARKLAILRAPSGRDSDDDFDVLGTASPYIFGNRLDLSIGLEPGHYLAELTAVEGAAAAVIDLDSRVDPSRAPKGRKVTPTPTRKTTTPDERVRMAQIDDILNEGIIVIDK